MRPRSAPACRPRCRESRRGTRVQHNSAAARARSNAIVPIVLKQTALIVPLPASSFLRANLEGQTVESHVCHQHVAAAAEHKQRHALFARPRARLGNLRLARSLGKPPRRAPYAEGRQRSQRNVLPESSKIKTTAMHEFRNRPSNHSVYCERLLRSLSMRTQSLRFSLCVSLPVSLFAFCLGSTRVLLGQVTASSSATTSTSDTTHAPDPDSGMTGHVDGLFIPLATGQPLPRQNRGADTPATGMMARSLRQK